MQDVSEFLDFAATVIQSNFRGYTQRKLYRLQVMNLLALPSTHPMIQNLVFRRIPLLAARNCLPLFSYSAAPYDSNKPLLQ